MRTSKTVNGVESTYLYLDGKPHGEVRDGITFITPTTVMTISLPQSE